MWLTFETQRVFDQQNLKELTYSTHKQFTDNSLSMGRGRLYSRPEPSLGHKQKAPLLHV